MLECNLETEAYQRGLIDGATKERAEIIALLRGGYEAHGHTFNTSEAIAWAEFIEAMAEQWGNLA
jgi:hypothetical protein